MNNNQKRKAIFEKMREYKNTIGVCKNYNCNIFKNCLIEIERLNNIINSIENEVRNTTEEMYKTLVKIDGRGYYSANLTRLDYLLDKIKALKVVKLTENDKKQVKWLKEEFKVGDNKE